MHKGILAKGRAVFRLTEMSVYKCIICNVNEKCKTVTPPSLDEHVFPLNCFSFKQNCFVLSCFGDIDCRDVCLLGALNTKTHI